MVRDECGVGKTSTGDIQIWDTETPLQLCFTGGMKVVHFYIIMGSSSTSVYRSVFRIFETFGLQLSKTI